MGRHRQLISRYNGANLSILKAHAGKDWTQARKHEGDPNLLANGSQQKKATKPNKLYARVVCDEIIWRYYHQNTFETGKSSAAKVGSNTLHSCASQVR